MNIYRFLAYVLMACAIVLIAAFADLLMHAGSPLSPEMRRALLVLLIVSIALILLILFLLCLARAKERLRDNKSLYKRAHGADRDERARAEQELARRAKTGLSRLPGICDVLVRRKFPRPCLQPPIKVTRRPDPCIYSQFFLMANNQPVTWDNPNVIISLGGVEQDTYNLAASTTYDVTVGIENASPFFDALGTQITVNLLSWGIGAPPSSLIASYAIDVPAATAFPGVPRTFPWPSPAAQGHYCIQVLIAHPDDVNVANNEGWNNTLVHRVNAGARFQLQIPVWARPMMRFKKDEREARNTQVQLALDSYVLNTANLPTDNLDALFARRAALWGATVTPQVTPVNANAPAQALFEAQVPVGAAPGTRATFNVTGAAGAWPVGGVTIHLDVI